MTTKQKKVIRLLLRGGVIAGNGWYRIIVFDKQRNPVMRIHKKTYDAVIPFCKKTKLGFAVSITVVRSQRKNSFIKKEYLNLKYGKGFSLD